jgi:ammonium transporter Rh
MSYVEEKFNEVYQMFTGIEIMMFFGFGYLMTFLKRYGMGAVGFTMLITVVGLQWGILTEVSEE